jgi:hypothetical protein
MTLTQDRLKQIIKEELEAIMNEVEEVDPEGDHEDDDGK